MLKKHREEKRSKHMQRSKEQKGKGGERINPVSLKPCNFPAFRFENFQEGFSKGRDGSAASWPAGQPPSQLYNPCSCVWLGTRRIFGLVRCAPFQLYDFPSWVLPRMGRRFGLVCFAPFQLYDLRSCVLPRRCQKKTENRRVGIAF